MLLRNFRKNKLLSDGEMAVSTCKQPYPCIIIDNLYNYNEQNLIWNELNFLLDGNKFQGPEGTGTSTLSSEPDNIKYRSNKKGIWLDNLYKNRSISNILTVNRKLFKYWDEILPKDIDCWWWKCIMSSEKMLEQDTTLISYYEDGEYYETHFDLSQLTTLTWFYKEPKSFDGGDLIINPPYDHLLSKTNSLSPYKIEVKHNRMVIFPGIVPHQVTSVKMNKMYRGEKGMGRFCITNFIQKAVE